jgi:hypothetical protein
MNSIFDQLASRVRALETDEPPVVYNLSAAAVATPPTQAQLNAAFGATAAQLRDGWAGIVYDVGAGNCWLAVSSDDLWWIVGGGGGAGVPHNVLSATHLDSLPAAVVGGDIIRGNATPLWERYPIGIHWQLLGVDAGGALPEWQSFDWDFHVIAAGGDGVHDHSGNPEGGLIPVGSITPAVPSGTGIANQVTYWSGANAVAGRASFTDDATTVTIDRNSATALLIEQNGVHDNVLIADTANGRVGINMTPLYPLDVTGDSRMVGHLAVGSTIPVADKRIVCSDTVLLSGASAEQFGTYSQMLMYSTVSAVVQPQVALIGRIIITAANTQNWDATAYAIGNEGSIYSIAGGAGTVDTATAFYVHSVISTTGVTFTNYAGLTIRDPGGAGRITNNRAIYILSQTSGASDWAIYSEATCPSYLAGYVGVGTVAPDNLFVASTGTVLYGYSLWDSNAGYSNKFTGFAAPRNGADYVGGILLADVAAGGVIFGGQSDDDAIAVKIIGAIGAAAPTVACITIRGAKFDGGTGGTALAATEILTSFQNNSATDIWRIYGDGSVAMGGAFAPSRLLHVRIADAVTNAVTYATRTGHTTSGAAAALFGVGHEDELEDSAGNMQVASEVTTLWAAATSGSESPLYRGTTYPAGSAGPGYFGFWTWNDLDNTARTVIPNGTGDVVGILNVFYAVNESGGGTSAGHGSAVPGGAVLTIYTDGVDTFDLTVAADGSVTVARTAGASTADISLFMCWV